MTQEQQETLNEIFLGKEDPDLAFKPMTNNLKEALIKDFRQLYQKEFTTDWKAQRFVRELEIKVMGLDNVEALINQKEKELLDKFEEMIGESEDRTPISDSSMSYQNGRNDLRLELRDRIKQLKEELKGGQDE